jgi:hypothetical protein
MNKKKTIVDKEIDVERRSIKKKKTPTIKRHRIYQSLKVINKLPTSTSKYYYLTN